MEETVFEKSFVRMTEFDIKEKLNKPVDPSLLTLLGRKINVKGENAAIKKDLKNFKLKFLVKSFTNLNFISLNSVKSLYGRLVISHDSIVKNYWDAIMELILGYNVLTTLYFLAYALPGDAMKQVDLFCWCLFLIDISVTFFTELKLDNGTKIRDFKRIAINYLKFWFLLDVFAIIPLSARGNPRIEYLFRMVRLLKLPGVLDITDGTGISYLLTYFNFGKRDKSGKIIYSLKIKIIASFVQLFVVILFIVYFLGCLWYWFQKTVDNYKYSSGDPYFDKGNFEEAYGLVGISSEHVALRSSYFMLTVIATIGYGDFLPTNVYEMAFISCIMVLGVTLFAVIMGSFNSALAFYTEYSSSGDTLGELNIWLDSIERSQGKIDGKLKEKILSHFDYYSSNDRLKSLAKNYWEAEKPEDLKEINQNYINELPEEVYFEVLNHLFKDFLVMFRSYFTESEFKFHLIPHLQPRQFFKDDYLLKSKEKPDEVLFILKGILSVGIQLEDKFESFCYFTNGRTVIGDYNALTDLPSCLDFIALSHLDALSINSKVFETLLTTFYKPDKDHILGIASVREIKFKRSLRTYIRSLSLNDSARDDILNRISIKQRILPMTKESFTEDEINSEFISSISLNKKMFSNSSLILSSLDSLRNFHRNLISST